ncbi:SusC/RagA family TonB-linked outer membrane protein [Pedobacter africanus]|uniref:TonB-linked outer membrane protein, SusC/RagA family n=1 Tax=Pedobacter africanus TaxID=151894 RepID=A0A1W2DUZ7_9SPHI|nr:SusC/RagA family TonB-linked outer membrane protein [Pedobacter africanus]SMD01273.1 TonB-linked outer membrane protein, SusC/RagA family [Pedobacter africanus]
MTFYKCFIRTTVRNVIVFLMITALAIAFNTANAHSQGITMNKRGINLSELFKELHHKYNYDFFYAEGVLDNSKRFDIAVSNATIDDVLKKTLTVNLLTYTINKNIVVIKPGPAYQQNSIQGRVLDENKVPLAGATVLHLNSKSKTTTDRTGAFRLVNVPLTGKLLISYIGYESMELPVAVNMGDVTLKNASADLQQVEINVGYGRRKAIDLTGSVTRVTEAELEGAPPHADIASMIQGKAAGVNVMVANGAPGAGVSVMIRGTTSLTGNSQPLWVVDGVPQYNVNGSDIGQVLYDYNINDIESVDILKDASATAIYGSRAANGVIIITTKSGKKFKKPQIDVAYNHGIQKQRDGFRTLTSEEFKQVITDATRNYYATTGSKGTGGILTLLDESKIVAGTEVDYYSAPFLSTAFFDGQTNWWKELTQNAIERKLDVSLRGGSDASSYYVSVGVPQQEGIIKGSRRRGFSGRVNLDSKVSDDFTMGLMLNGSNSNIDNKDGMIAKIWDFRPDFPMYTADGKIFDPGYNEENPLTTLKNRDLSVRKGVNGSAFLQFTPAKAWTLRSAISINYNQTVTDRFTREGTAYSTHKGQANISQNESNNWVFENTARFAKLFNQVHDLDFLAGFSMERGTFKAFSVGVQNFPDQDIMTNLSSGTTPLKPMSSSTSTALVSAFTRANYKFKDRYLATFTFRADGSSRFGPDRRWGLFPSGALAWIITRENFMQHINTDVFNLLKLRGSYGISGSQVLGNNDWRTTYAGAQFEEQPGFAPNQLGNANLRWEQTLTKEAALDYGFFKNKISGSFGVYDKETRDIIYNKNIPSSSAFISVKQNIATIRNKGIEFFIDYNVFRKRDMSLTFNFNIAHNTSTVTQINGVDKFIDLYGGNALAIRMQEGQPMGQWYGYKWSGRYYQSMEEYNLLSSQNPTTGAKVWYQNGQSNIRPGDLKFDDTNGDGIVNNDDKVPLGTFQPKYFGGFAANFRKGGLSLNMNFTYSTGALRYWYTNSANWYGVGLFMRNYPEYVLDSWSTTNRLSPWPRMAYGEGSSNNFSDFWLSKADYLRLSQVRISYRFPDKWIQSKIKGGLDLAVSASNLLTFTNYNGIDPEGNFKLSGGATGTGTDFGTYPSIRTFNLSIRYSLR